jgi:hypothetical protein
MALKMRGSPEGEILLPPQPQTAAGVFLRPYLEHFQGDTSPKGEGYSFNIKQGTKHLGVQRVTDEEEFFQTKGGVSQSTTQTLSEDWDWETAATAAVGGLLIGLALWRAQSFALIKALAIKWLGKF